MQVRVIRDARGLIAPRSVSTLAKPAVALVLANFALFLCFVFNARVTAPVSDMLDWRLAWIDAHGSGEWLSYLWAAHNEHRLIWSRILVAIDVQLIGAQGWTFFVTSLGLLAATVGLLAHSARSGPLRTPLVLALSLILFQLFNWSLVGFPAMGVYLQTVSAVVLALVIATEGRPTAARAVTASLVGAAAAFGGSAGLIVFPVLVWMLWARGAKPMPIVSAAVLGAAFGVVYLAGLPRPEHAPVSVSQLSAWADYSFRFMGLPWAASAALLWPGRMIGAFLLVASAACVIDVSTRKASRVEILAAGLMLYVVALAVCAGPARADLTPDHAIPVRYSIFVSLIHCGLLIYAASRFPPLPSRFVWLGLIGLGTIALAQNLIVGPKAIRESAAFNEAWSRFQRGEWTPDMDHFIYPNEAHARMALERLKRQP